eukprot:Blabericola_migrator_1__4034@NODE_2227_length_3093_cov_236_911104_g1403_i0_p4_GENE_NODE_2227_length_3093_cov_236_911104_g1403_i0NODE_2227_length_3093_cov_236_911104_g1403_i0_p4_ORF_typecomplete_len117_score9_87_NODE_2227_length_3093_cov_236_911104_g1403_i017132063
MREADFVVFPDNIHTASSSLLLFECLELRKAVAWSRRQNTFFDFLLFGWRSHHKRSRAFSDRSAIPADVKHKQHTSSHIIATNPFAGHNSHEVSHKAASKTCIIHFKHYLAIHDEC